jgi:cytochrome P450
MEASTEALVDEPVPAVDSFGLPPRPDLSRFMMSAGFILTPTRFLDACQRRCGDYFTLRPARDRTLVVTADPAAVKQVFTGDPRLLHAGEGNAVLGPILGSGSTLLLDGPEHLRHRRLLLPPFHGERMRKYGTVMAEVAEREVAAWPRGRRFPVLPSMQSITLEVIMRAVFGVDDRDRRELIGKPLRRLLDMVGSRRRVLMLGLTIQRTALAAPGPGSLRPAAKPMSCSTKRSARVAPTRSPPSGTTCSRCCSRLATRTAGRSPTPSCGTS